jgi:hypothetical protein
MRVRLAFKEPPGEGDAGWRNVRERVGPSLTGQPAFVHGWWGEQESKRGVSVSLWADHDIDAHEAALRAVPPLEGVDPGRIRQPDRRIVLDVLAEHGVDRRGGRSARFASFDPEEPAADREWVRDHLVPALTAADGFLCLILCRDVGSGEIVSFTVWESVSAIEVAQAAIRDRARGAGTALPVPSSVEVFEIVHEVVSDRHVGVVREVTVRWEQRRTRN